MKSSHLLIVVANVLSAMAMFYFVAFNHNAVGIVASVVVFMFVDLAAMGWLLRASE